jgi:hypothetical protein
VPLPIATIPPSGPLHLPGRAEHGPVEYPGAPELGRLVEEGHDLVRRAVGDEVDDQMRLPVGTRADENELHPLAGVKSMASPSSMRQKAADLGGPPPSERHGKRWNATSAPSRGGRGSRCRFEATSWARSRPEGSPSARDASVRRSGAELSPRSTKRWRSSSQTGACTDSSRR